MSTLSSMVKQLSAVSAASDSMASIFSPAASSVWARARFTSPKM